jgi:hypothetical protein
MYINYNIPFLTYIKDTPKTATSSGTRLSTSDSLLFRSSINTVALFTKILTMKHCRKCKTKIIKSFTNILTIILSVKFVLTLRVRLVRNIASVCIKPDLFQWTFINMRNKVCHTVGENALTVNGSLIFKPKRQSIVHMGWIFLVLCFFLLIQRCCMKSVIGLGISGCNNIVSLLLLYL